jgi:UDP-2,3-diacylglucosamine pyrophosphatase LpxH
MRQGFLSEPPNNCERKPQMFFFGLSRDSVYNELERFAALVATTEKQKVVEYMNSRAFATGHGDTIEDLLKEMEWQVAEREREACKKLAQEHAAEYRVGGRLYAPLGENYALCAAVACDHIVHLIEERGRK